MRVWTMALAVGTVTGAAWGQADAGIASVLDGLRGAGEETLRSLPDFTCEETVQSGWVAGAKVVRQGGVRSTYRLTRNPNGTSPMRFLETRLNPATGTAVDLRKETLPFWEEEGYWTGVQFTAGLAATEHRGAMTFAWVRPAMGIEGLTPGRTVEEISFHGPEASAKTGYRQPVAGEVWVDAESGALLRLGHLGKLGAAGNVPGAWVTGEDATTTTVTDFAEVKLGDRSFVLPRRIVVTTRATKTDHMEQVQVEYAACRRFTVKSEILPAGGR